MLAASCIQIGAFGSHGCKVRIVLDGSVCLCVPGFQRNQTPGVNGFLFPAIFREPSYLSRVHVLHFVCAIATACDGQCLSFTKAHQRHHKTLGQAPYLICLT